MPQKPPKLFISYAREDEDYKDKLVEHLKVLARRDVIASWHDGLLAAGQEWNEEIVKSLNEARVVLLLVSHSFIASDYISRVELAQAGERYERGEVSVIPVLVSNVHGWQSVPFGRRTLGAFQAVPRSLKFIADWPNQNAAFAEVVAEIEKAVSELKPLKEEAFALPPSIPSPPSFGFVPRAGRDGRDIIERLKEELAPENRRLVALWGAGGVGKTTLAAEAVRAIAAASGQRVVWVTADGRPNFTFTTLLDDIAQQFDRIDLRPLAVGPKEDAVRGLLADAPTLVVLDDFETIPPEEEPRCLEFLAQRAQCPALITTRQKVEHARLIPIDKMREHEADDFLDRLVAQTGDPDIYTPDVRRRILETAESNPLVVQWVVGQIDLAQAPDEVLTELSQGEGTAAERVFDRSFNLKQMEEGGRAVLLALSLFKPSGTRPAVAEVAGMNITKDRDKKRFRKAQQILASLRLIKQTPDGQRLAVAGLTRDLAKARLSRDPRAKTFRPRFVTRFVRYAEAHKKMTAANLNALEDEKDNVLGAMDVAYEIEDWRNVSHTYFEIHEFLFLRGYWDESLRRGEQAIAVTQMTQDIENILGVSSNVARVRMERGEHKEARQTWEQELSYYKKVGREDDTSEALNNLGILAEKEGDLVQARLLYKQSLEIDRKRGNQSGVAASLHNLGSLAYIQGNYVEARRLYIESLEIEKKVGNQNGVAVSLHQLGRLALEEGKLDEAENYWGQSLSILKKLGDKLNTAECLETIGDLRVVQGRYEEAEALFDESSELLKGLSSPSRIGSLKYSRGLLAEKRGDMAGAEQLFRESLDILEGLDFYAAKRAREALVRVSGKGEGV
jgi:tetratricopeptide (TPR) repeat protein